MDKAKKDRIENFLRYFPGYSVATLAEWLKQKAPNLQTKAERAYNNAMNEFLGAVCGKEPVKAAETPIPFSGSEDAFGSEAWLFLGTYGITLEDCADFVSEYRTAEAQKKANESMGMSNALRALRGGERVGAGDLIARSERINAHSDVSMSQFLQDMRAGNEGHVTLRVTDRW